MHTRMLAAAAATACFGVTVAAHAATIFAEDFSDGNADARWDDDDSTPTTVEDWVGPGGATARGLATTYDHDQDAGTANIDIPGGIEIMDAGGATPITTQAFTTFTLPVTVDVGVAGELTYFGTQRLAGSSGGNGPKTVEVTNTTDNRVILSTTATFVNFNWAFGSHALTFIADDLGDTIELRFGESVTGGGSAGARGLEVADIEVTATLVPEPASAALLGLGALTMLRRRR